MDHENFSRLAREVYGHFTWRSAVARRHYVNRSTVYRWSIGEAPVPDRVAADLHKEAARKARTIQALVAE